MSTFPDHFHRCMRHPHQPIVGVCASCLRERLAVLHQPRREDKRPDSRSVESSFQVPSQGRSARPPRVDGSSKAGLVIHDTAVVQVQDSGLQKPKSDASSPDTTHKDVSTFSPRSHQRNTSLPSRISNASESDRSSKTDADAQRKKRTSLWSLFHQNEEARELRNSSRGKAGQPNSTTQGSDEAGPSSSSAGRDSQDRRRLEQLTSAMRSPGFSAGRKSREFTVGSTNTRQTYLADLGVVVESREHSESTSSSSWISSLFQRRKPRSKCVSVSKNSIVETTSGTWNGMMESSRSSLDAGRLSLDGARLNFKQILKMQEARSRQAQLERSPVVLEYAKRFNATDKKGALVAELSSSQQQKRKSVISNPSARSSISVDIVSNFQAVQEHSSSREGVGNNDKSSRVEERQRNSGGMRGITETEADDQRQFSRSRSWGRAWSKTLSSPLWSFKHHNRRDPGIHELLPSSTPNHTHITLETSTSRKDSGSSTFGFHSPLRRFKHSTAGGSLLFPH